MESPDRGKIKVHRLGKDLKGPPKTSEFSVAISEETLGEGVFAKTNAAHLTIERGDKVREHPFVLKRFKKYLESKDKKRQTQEDVGNAAQLIKMHRALKEAGVTHIPVTYHIAETSGDEVALLITDLTKDGKQLVFTNHTKSEQMVVPELKDFNKMLEELENEIQRATKASIYVPLDAYFLLVPQEGERAGTVDFSIVDYDRCRVDRKQTPQELYKINIAEAGGMILDILNRHLSNKENRTMYVQELDDWEEGALNRGLR